MIVVGKVFDFLLLFISCIIVLYSILAAKKRVPSIKRIAAFDAIEEAIGRSSEMGRPLFFSGGDDEVSSSDGPQTVAGYAILGYIAQIAAQRGTNLLVGVKNAEALPLADETLRTGYLIGGAPEAYNKESVIQYFPDRSHVVSIVALMKREKPSSTVMVGPFYWESIVFGETGRSINAFQVAGTAKVMQIPFLVATCDYTLIGEEIFAGAAYCKKDKLLLGSLRGQDIIKCLIIILLVLTIASFNVGLSFLMNLLRM